MSNSDLISLAERVERATGPDRELDGLIGMATQPNRDWVRFSDTWCARDEDDGVAFDVPIEFTASIDAAMGLIPAGCGVTLDRYWIREGARWMARLSTGGTPEVPRAVHECWDAATPALALVAASLRAIASEVSK